MIDLRVNDPIVVDNHGDLMIFQTADAAQSYMEPIDIENGEYEVHDAVGNRLDIFVTETGRVPTVTLRTVAGRLPEPEKVEEKLRSFLLRVGRDARAVHGASLQELVEMSAEYSTR
jgi:hypothetical protein